MDSLVFVTNNILHYKVAFLKNQMILYKFGKAQVIAKMLVKGHVHKMCDVQGYGFLLFNPRFDIRLRKVKIYQVLCHEILAVIQNKPW